MTSNSTCVHCCSLSFFHTLWNKNINSTTGKILYTIGVISFHLLTFGIPLLIHHFLKHYPSACCSRPFCKSNISLKSNYKPISKEHNLVAHQYNPCPYKTLPVSSSNRSFYLIPITCLPLSDTLLNVPLGIYPTSISSYASEYLSSITETPSPKALPTQQQLQALDQQFLICHPQEKDKELFSAFVTSWIHSLSYQQKTTYPQAFQKANEWILSQHSFIHSSDEAYTLSHAAADLLIQAEHLQNPLLIMNNILLQPCHMTTLTSYFNSLSTFTQIQKLHSEDRTSYPYIHSSRLLGTLWSRLQEEPFTHRLLFNEFNFASTNQQDNEDVFRKLLTFAYQDPISWSLDPVTFPFLLHLLPKAETFVTQSLQNLAHSIESLITNNSHWLGLYQDFQQSFVSLPQTSPYLHCGILFCFLKNYEPLITLAFKKTSHKNSNSLAPSLLFLHFYEQTCIYPSIEALLQTSLTSSYFTSTYPENKTAASIKRGLEKTQMLHELFEDIAQYPSTYRHFKHIFAPFFTTHAHNLEKTIAHAVTDHLISENDYELYLEPHHFIIDLSFITEQSHFQNFCQEPLIYYLPFSQQLFRYLQNNPLVIENAPLDQKDSLIQWHSIATLFLRFASLNSSDLFTHQDHDILLLVSNIYSIAPFSQKSIQEAFDSSSITKQSIYLFKNLSQHLGATFSNPHTAQFFISYQKTFQETFCSMPYNKTLFTKAFALLSQDSEDLFLFNLYKDLHLHLCHNYSFCLQELPILMTDDQLLALFLDAYPQILDKHLVTDQGNALSLFKIHYQENFENTLQNLSWNPDELTSIKIEMTLFNHHHQKLSSHLAHIPSIRTKLLDFWKSETTLDVATEKALLEILNDQEAGNHLHAQSLSLLFPNLTFYEGSWNEDNDSFINNSHKELASLHQEQPPSLSILYANGHYLSLIPKYYYDSSKTSFDKEK